MKPEDHIVSSNYAFVEEIELTRLSEYDTHRRLGVFFHKGTKCANPLCDRVGTRLVYGRDNGGQVHLDVYTEDMVLMTVDHVIPRSLGGSDALTNKEPMCRPCNGRKGNSFVGVDQFDQMEANNKHHKSRKKVVNYGRKWRKCIRKATSIEYTGVGDLLVDRPNPSMLELLRRSKEYRDSKLKERNAR